MSEAIEPVAPVISAEGRIIAQVVAGAFGGQPSVARFWDERRRSFVDIATKSECPQLGVTSYSTISLSESPLYDNGREYEPTRIELTGACQSLVSGFGAAISTAAFCIINSKWFCFPGAIFPNIVAMHELSRSLEHFFFIEPFLWEGLQTRRVRERTVSWLMAIPISDREYQYAATNGHDALNRLFQSEQIDVFDINRPSAV